MKQAVALCAISLLMLVLAGDSAHAQQQPAAHLTIADCPAGWRLGIAETGDPQAAVADTQQTANTGKTMKPDALTPDQAPRQFVTGCMPPVAASPQK